MVGTEYKVVLHHVWHMSVPKTAAYPARLAFETLLHLTRLGSSTLSVMPTGHRMSSAIALKIDDPATLTIEEQDTDDIYDPEEASIVDWMVLMHGATMIA